MFVLSLLSDKLVIDVCVHLKVLIAPLPKVTVSSTVAFAACALYPITTLLSPVVVVSPASLPTKHYYVL